MGNIDRQKKKNQLLLAHLTSAFLFAPAVEKMNQTIRLSRIESSQKQQNAERMKKIDSSIAELQMI